MKQKFKESQSAEFPEVYLTLTSIKSRSSKWRPNYHNQLTKLGEGKREGEGKVAGKDEKATREPESFNDS